MWTFLGNGDGKLNLVVEPCAPTIDASTIAVALRNGNGMFQTPVLHSALLNPVPFSSVPLAIVATSDLNGDGIPDIVTAGGTTLFGDGKGGVASRLDYASNGAGSVMLGDFDGDGKTDILFGNGDATYL